MKIVDLITENSIRVPIRHIKDSLYLIGINRINCELKNDKVNLRVGGGPIEF
jgi:hypothetical protein